MDHRDADIIIVGAGASGMMAAATAAAFGTNPMILEGSATPGKKILSTGNGRCNFTNLRLKREGFYSAQSGAAMSVIRTFDAKAAIAQFADWGVFSHDRDGYVYPRSDQAASVRSALLNRMKVFDIPIRTGCRVKSIQAKGPGRRGITHYRVLTEDGRSYSSQMVILACGGAAAPKTGSDGSGFELAKSLGHKIIAPVPALVPLTAAENFCRTWEHVRTQGRIRIETDGKVCGSDVGELQLTAYGISGIPVFQVSRHASRALALGKQVKAKIDFLPEWSEEQWNQITAPKGLYWHLTTEIFLKGLFPEKLADVLLQVSGVKRDLWISKWSAADRKRMRRCCRDLELNVTGTRGFDAAQVTAGGVSTRELDLPRLESRIHPGLFFAGEIVDVDGICGGYNLQWAWSSGYSAGRSAAEGVRPE